MSANDFTKLAAAMASIDTEVEGEDTQNLTAAQMADALKALADVSVQDQETYFLGWTIAQKSAWHRYHEKLQAMIEAQENEEE